MTARSLSDFISEVKTRGLSRSNRFTVSLSLPRTLQARSAYGGNNLSWILLFCDQTTLPGVNLSTTQSRTFGEYRELPYEKTYDPITLNFFVDKDMIVKKLFDDWVGSIQDPVLKTFSYYKDYTVEIDIDVQDLENNTRYKVKLEEAYPKTINAITLDYGSRDVMKLGVQFQYRSYRSALFNSPAGIDVSETQSNNLPADYYNDFGSFQGRYNDFNNTIQNGAVQTFSTPSGIITETGSSVLNFA